MSLTAHALAAHHQHVATLPAELEAREQELREEFLARARDTAGQRLGPAAAELRWQYTAVEDLPETIEEATAPLAPDGRHNLALRYAWDDDAEAVQFGLVESCTHCACRRVTEVTDLAHLGRLLAAEDGGR